MLEAADDSGRAPLAGKDKLGVVAVGPEPGLLQRIDQAPEGVRVDLVDVPGDPVRRLVPDKVSPGRLSGCHGPPVAVPAGRSLPREVRALTRRGFQRRRPQGWNQGSTLQRWLHPGWRCNTGADDREPGLVVVHVAGGAFRLPAPGDGVP